jgi:dTDP-4-dehydrorhamnose 3,5-epimerase
MLQGIKIKTLKRRPDERGFFTELMRKDWTQILEDDELVQANLSITYPGIVRAWHRHLRGQVDYFIALRGALKICAYDSETKELDEIISTGQEPQIVRIPGRYWHGFKAIGTSRVWLLYFVNKLYDYERPDDERRPWNDSNIIPKTINGKTDDPRVGKPWDWNYPPHR